jgi:DNA-binding beta-propeller fold protein YncE
MPTKPAGAPRADYAHLRTQPQIRRWELSGHTGRIESVAFSPNGNLLASTGRDRVVRLWNPLTRQPVGQPIQIEGAGSLARRVAFSFDGKLLACTTNSQTVWLLDPRTGRFTGRIVIDQARPTTAILAIAFTPHWNVLAVGGSDNTVRLVDPLNGRLLTHTLLHDNPVRAMAFSPDGRHLAVSDGASVRIWDPSADKLVGALSTGDAGKDYRGIPTPLHSVAFSPDGTFCAAGGDRRTFIWEASTGRLHGWVEAPAGFNRFNTVAFSPDSTILATGDSRKTVSLWDPRTGAQIGHPIINGAASLGADVESLAFSPDGMLLATSAPDKIVRLWQIGR